MLTAMVFAEWLLFGVFAAFEFGKIAYHGVMLPLVLSAIFGIAGMVAILILVGKAVAARKPLALVLIGAISLAALVTSAWLADTISARSSDVISGNAMLGAGVYFLVSAAIVSVGVVIVWIRQRLDIRKINGQAHEKAYRH